MDELRQVLDERAYDWLRDNQSNLLSVIEKVIVKGQSSPEKIRHFVYRETRQDRLSLMCEQAARHIMGWLKPVEPNGQLPRPEPVEGSGGVPLVE